MIEHYVKVLKEIQALQEKLSAIDQTEKSVRNEIKQLESRKSELEKQKATYESQIKTLLLLEQNKQRIDNRIMASVESDIVKLYEEQNHIESKTASTNRLIDEKTQICDILSSKRAECVNRLKRLYVKRDLFQDSLISIYDKGEQPNIKAKVM